MDIRIGESVAEARPLASRDDADSALERGLLYVAMGNGKWWRARRNGKTKTWVREPGRFEIPVKAGLKAYGRITQDDIGGTNFVALVKM